MMADHRFSPVTIVTNPQKDITKLSTLELGFQNLDAPYNLSIDNLEFVDITGDGLSDVIIIAEIGATRQLLVYRNNGAGGFILHDIDGVLSPDIYSVTDSRVVQDIAFGRFNSRWKSGYSPWVWIKGCSGYICK